MYTAFLEQAGKRIAAVRQHAALSNLLVGLVQKQIEASKSGGGSAILEPIVQTVPDRVEWRLIEHCSVVTRIYALYEQFAQEMIREHLSLLQGCSAYSNLCNELKVTHRKGISTILDKKDGPRYGGLDLSNLVEQYASALADKAYVLEPAAFLVQEQNLRLPELNRLFSGCGIFELASWIEAHDMLKAFFASGDRLGGSAEHEMRELIKYRNEAAHGSIEIDDLPGIDYLYEFCDFIAAVCSAIGERVQLASANKLIDSRKAIVGGKVSETFRDGQIIVGNFAGRYRIGDSILLQGLNYCTAVIVKSLQVNDQNRDEVVLDGGTELGIGISGCARKRASVICFAPA